MPDVAKLKKKAAELELKKQFDKALAVYVEILDSYAGRTRKVDVALYNRVGDIYLKQGNTADAVDYYEQAVDRYAESGFFNNAIALCNKILRNSPGRASIYYKLGKISAQKGFIGDAKVNFLEYADRMQKAGKIDEAFRALKEFADLCPDQDDIRLLLADQLSKQERGQEAIEQLQMLYERYSAQGRELEARATVDRMKAIDPAVKPRESGASSSRSNDLIFLDLEERRSRSNSIIAKRADVRTRHHPHRRVPGGTADSRGASHRAARSRAADRLRAARTRTRAARHARPEPRSTRHGDHRAGAARRRDARRRVRVRGCGCDAGSSRRPRDHGIQRARCSVATRFAGNDPEYRADRYWREHCASRVTERAGIGAAAADVSIRGRAARLRDARAKGAASSAFAERPAAHRRRRPRGATARGDASGAGRGGRRGAIDRWRSPAHHARGVGARVGCAPRAG
jgi:tetratricopeptide (TPR) repeat protein